MEQVAAVGSRRARALGHHCANAGVNLDYTFFYQVRNYLMGCIGIDLQSLAEFSHGGKRVTSAQLA